MLRAVADRRVLTVSGEAAESFARISVRFFSENLAEIGVEDTDATQVPIEGDIDRVRHLDLRGLEGAGASVSWSVAANSIVRGSRQDDYLSSYGDGDDRINGYAGDDYLDSGDGDDALAGGRGADTLRSRRGDDLLRGNEGDDLIDGGADFDTMVLTGDRDEYDLGIVDGAYVLEHVSGDGDDGTDTFANVEALRFADETLEIRSSPSDLAAVADGRRLTVSGEAAVSGSSRQISVRLFSEAEVEDNGAVAAQVPIEGDAARVRHLDLRGLEGAGASVSWDAAANGIVRGSRQDDDVYSYGDGDDRISGYAGDDYLDGGDGDDALAGGRGADTLRGDRGDDLLRGDEGDDLIDGGADVDAIVLTGDRDEYDLEIVGGNYVLAHARGDRDDGTDTFANVEALRFADQTLAVRSAPTDLVAVAAGRQLTVSGEAAVAESFRQVTIEFFAEIEIEDNGAVTVPVPVEGAIDRVRHLDLRDLEGAGASVSWGAAANSVIRGSQQDDYLYSYGDGDDRLYGYAGADALDGREGDDRLAGGRGDDFLRGLGGDDLIDGGADFDTIVLAGGRDEYDLDIVDDDYVLAHARGARDDGTDVFANVEALMFADETVALGDMLLM